MFIYIYMYRFSVISLLKRVIIYIYMYHNSINAASEANGVMNVVNVVYMYIPDERGALATNEL